MPSRITRDRIQDLDTGQPAFGVLVDLLVLTSSRRRSKIRPIPRGAPSGGRARAHERGGAAPWRAFDGGSEDERHSSLPDGYWRARPRRRGPDAELLGGGPVRRRGERRQGGRGAQTGMAGSAEGAARGAVPRTAGLRPLGWPG